MDDSVREVLCNLCARSLTEYLQLAPVGVTLKQLVREIIAAATIYLDKTVADNETRARYRKVLDDEIVPEVLDAAVKKGMIQLANGPVPIEVLRAGGVKSTLSNQFRQELLAVCRDTMRSIQTCGRLAFTYDQTLDLLAMAAMHHIATKAEHPVERLRLMSGCQEAILTALQEATDSGETALILDSAL